MNIFSFRTVIKSAYACVRALRLLNSFFKLRAFQSYIRYLDQVCSEEKQRKHFSTGVSKVCFIIFITSQSFISNIKNGIQGKYFFTVFTHQVLSEVLASLASLFAAVCL